ncbi:MAG TPA: hypothetical protein VMT22_04460 [Terriglobales bacterium]|nr:hypothetical protein [Terriglobales bacterium]
MSKKDKKIKLLKKELKELKAQVRKLKLASVSRRRNKMAKVLGQLPKPQAPASTPAEIERSPNNAAETKKTAARVVGQH